MAFYRSPFFKRNLLRAASVAAFAGLLYVLDKYLPVLGPRIEHLEIIAISLIIVISIIVMFFWAHLGVFGGLMSFLTAMIFLYRPLTDLNPYYYSVLIMAFFTNSFIGYHIFRKISVASQKYTVEMEKIQENTNLIKEHMKNREAEVCAITEKIGGLYNIKNIADRLSLELSGEEVIKIVSEETFQIFGKDKRVLFFLLNEEKKSIDLSCAITGERRKAFIPECGGLFEKWVMENMKSLLVRDVKKDFRFAITEDMMEDRLVSLMVKPLIVDNNLLGLLRVDAPHESAFVQHELRLLDIIGDLAAVALENARLYRRTEELAIKDSLTGLYVHRYFMERLDGEVKRAVHSDARFGLIMLDIDNFKEFNDKYGHISGDTILKRIARILKSKTSAGDIAARYGGEEFIFLTLNRDREDVLNFANEIRKDIQNSPVVLRREKCSVTVSVGAAIFPEDAKTMEGIVREVDKCLYRAKTKGKNTVCST
ncbi:MAG: sensor domain-containing diguanylate cyclase [Candidatus Omnitrophota bacterium]